MIHGHGDGPLCRVCGHRFHEGFESGDGELGWRFVDHVPCVERTDARFRAERRLRQKAESALSETLHHPNAKPQRLAEYTYRIEQAAAKYDAEVEP